MALLALASAASAQSASAGPLPLEAMRDLASAYDLLRQGQVAEPSGEALLIAAIRGMVQAHDPEGEYYTRDELTDLRNSANGATRSTLGLRLTFRPRAVLVSAIAPGGPAAATGLKPGVLIESVDGRPISDLRSFQVHRLLDGEPGSTAVLEVIARGERAARRIEVVRAAPVRVEQRLDRPAPGQAVLRPGQFHEQALVQLAAQLGREWTQQRFDSLVLDLRGHPGGLLDASIGVAAMFLPADALVLKTVGRLPEANQRFLARPQDYSRRDDPLARLPVGLRSLPLAVLVDGDTASGAEIVAAALQDHGRAVIVGQRTQGRGSIQTVRPLSERGALKYTTAVWESPSGARLEGRGVVPDVAQPEGDAALALAGALAEAKKRQQR